jgi:hypothetical protein
MSQWNPRVYRLTHKREDVQYNFDAAMRQGHGYGTAVNIAQAIRREAKKKRGRRGDW